MFTTRDISDYCGLYLYPFVHDIVQIVYCTYNKSIALFLLIFLKMLSPVK